MTVNIHNIFNGKPTYATMTCLYTSAVG